jgi:Ca2+-binding RTX toxin-like protein
MAHNVRGTSGNDTLNQSGASGPGTVVGLAGNDSILTGSGLVTVTGDSGNDTVVLKADNTGTVNGGTENDSIDDNDAAIGSMALFGDAGADTISAFHANSPLTIIGGIDSNDGSDWLIGGTSNDITFGNGGDDSIFDVGGDNTLVGGFGNDVIVDENGLGIDLIFGNQGNDLIGMLGTSTIFAGAGDDCVLMPGSGPHSSFSAIKGLTASAFRAMG